MRVLLVTGQLAQAVVTEYAKESAVETEVIALKTAVAAFLTPQSILEGLREKTLVDFGMILTPGLVRGDTSVITQATGIPTFKGPRYAADLPFVLDMLCEVSLSVTVPADVLLKEKIAIKAQAEIQKTESKRDELLKHPGNTQIGNVAIGRDFPMRVLAEIVDAAQMDKTAIQQIATRFVAAGADFIDVGMVAGESQPQRAGQIVAWVKEVVTVPVSIDTLDPAEIRAAIKAGVELVLSGDAGNLEEIAPYVSDVAVVIIPTDQRQGYFPKKATDRVRYLEETIAKAKMLGITQCIADLILEPIDILESFLAYKMFAERNPEVPIFVGVSNVSELFDADSVGINALLARLSSEVGGNILLATEQSPKARGTVAEEVVAAKMMFLAKKRGAVPKDLGIDLLILKDKRRCEELYDPEIEAEATVITAPDMTEPAVLDELGVFRIGLDRTAEVLIVAHYASSDLNKPDCIIKGKNAKCVYVKILSLGLVSRLDHAAYLGEELTKAEIALQTGKQYLQDSGLFMK